MLIREQLCCQEGNFINECRKNRTRPAAGNTPSSLLITKDSILRLTIISMLIL